MDECNVKLRKFQKEDIDDKIRWINDDKNNEYLHYDLPLVYDKTLLWYNKVKDDKTRYDAVIEYDNKAIGVIGLINIDEKRKKEKYYITLGEHSYKGKGIATIATKKELIMDLIIIILKKFGYVWILKILWQESCMKKRDLA